MSQADSQSGRKALVVRGLAIVAAINCVVVPILFAQQRPLFPLPGLYLLEISVLGIMGLTAVLVVESEAPRWRAVPWLAAGVLLAFVILGGFSIGFFLIPATFAFLLVGVLQNPSTESGLLRSVGFFLIAAIAQATLIVALAGI